MEAGRRLQIVTNCLVLAFLVFNAVLLYHVWGQLKRIEVELAEAREVVGSVKKFVDDVDRAVKALKSGGATAKDMVQETKEKLRHVRLDDVLKEIQIQIDKKERKPPSAPDNSEDRPEDGAAPESPQP